MLSRARTLARKTTSAAAKPVTLPAAMALSGTYLYPLSGMTYFTMTPILWAYLFTILLPELILTIVVYSAFYLFLYPLEAGLAVFLNGPSGLITAWIALLHQSAMAAQLMSDMFLMPTPLKLLFDAVMSREGHDELVLRAKLKRSPNMDAVGKTKKFAKKVPKYALWPSWAFKCFLRISLHFIPIVGPMVIVVMDGPKHGKRAHNRYFELKRYDSKEAEHYVKSRRGQYWGFGIVAGALETVPILGIVFTFTNTVGAAIWASQIETKMITRAKMLAENNRHKQRPKYLN